MPHNPQATRRNAKGMTKSYDQELREESRWLCFVARQTREESRRLREERQEEVAASHYRLARGVRAWLEKC